MSEKYAKVSALLMAPALILAQWMLPGLGYILLGQKARGITIGAAILILFTMGLYIGGMKVVTPADSLSFEAFITRPWYVGQCLVGPIAIFTGKLAQNPNAFASHAKTNEIALLYTAVAGMMNLFTFFDLARSHAQKEVQP